MKFKELTECPYYLVYRASLVITSMMKNEFISAGVGKVRPTYLGVLWSLWEQDRMKVVDLARKVGLEPSTMTGLLDRMERDGLVSRVPDPLDRRVLRIVLSEEGCRVKQPVLKVVEVTLDKVLKNVPDADLKKTTNTLRQVLINADLWSTL